MIRYIHELVENLACQSRGWKVAFFSAPERAPVNLWLRDSDMVFAWSKELPYAAAVSEPTVVEAFHRYYDELWESVPRVNRDPARVIAELLKLIT
jgi:hypothetical protein